MSRIAVPHRRTLRAALLLVVALVATSCSSGGTPEERSPETVTLVDSTGEIRVPRTSERIWALDELAALQLLALGVVPTHAGELYDIDYADPILDAAGVERVPPNSVERVAGARPSLIIGIESPQSEALRVQLEQIAPVILPRYAAPWQDQLGVLAAATGRTDRASSVVGEVDDFVDALARRIATSSTAGASVSLISGCGPGTICAYDNSTVAGSLVSRLGFARPPAQIDDDPTDSGFAFLSEERLAEQRADIVIAYVGDVSGGTSILDSPLLDTAGARTATVEFDAWYFPSPLAAWRIAHDLESITLGDGRPTTTQDVPRLWAELTGAQ